MAEVIIGGLITALAVGAAKKSAKSEARREARKQAAEDSVSPARAAVTQEATTASQRIQGAMSRGAVFSINEPATKKSTLFGN